MPNTNRQPVSETLPTPNGKLGGSVPLVFLTLLLTLVAVGVVVTTQKAAPKPEVYAAACKDQIESAVLDGVREITRTCQDKQPVTPPTHTTKVLASDNRIGFAYPDGWSTRVNIDATGATPWKADLVPGPFITAEGTEGQFIDITLTSGLLSVPAIQAVPSFTDYLNTYFAGTNGFSEISITQVAEGTATRYQITGFINLFGLHPFEAIYYTGSMSWASATFMDSDANNTNTNDVWELIKDSLDFSGIK